MRKQIIVNSNPNEVRVALLENGVLAEVHIQRSSEEAAAGNIYKGKVLRVLPGMQAAFVDIGLEKAGFLHASDVVGTEASNPSDNVDPEEVQYDEPDPSWRYLPIEKKVRPGNELIVQIAKEPLGTKGARITSHVSLPGKYLVYMPTASQIGISKRIEQDRERRRLRSIIASAKPKEGGLIARTACEGLAKDDIVTDIRNLSDSWNNIRTKASRARAPALVHSELDLVLRCVRDMLSEEVDEIVIDSAEETHRTTDYISSFMPELANRVREHRGAEPIFDRYGVEEQVDRATEPKVWLKSGGYLVIDQGEALTMVDVNTGRYVGRRSQEETVLKTNLEAATEVVQQLRLRNIGGIIIIDFIDMDESAHRERLMETLEVALQKDKTRTSVLRISEMGLVQMTRKRTRENLERLLSSPCPNCDGRGRIKSVPTMAHEILRKIQREAARTPKNGGRITVRANRDVISYLFNDEEHAIRALQRRLGRNVTLKVAEKYPQEQYDIVAA